MRVEEGHELKAICSFAPLHTCPVAFRAACFLEFVYVVTFGFLFFGDGFPVWSVFSFHYVALLGPMKYSTGRECRS
ncbi:hypothetical protein METBIDRAFT_152767 [Metschnikowia bicuspidata var. bicuspidata NRRL YB-4993]|uniref:Uncharacterized protein n=1 Tax=Metschnikowia bicuspidata var. bicuspidata NRRL YB-4993 TaxID=869754 RepID=A0A1A0HEG6_9ASCO|nr:hypothetical protein METBIDRAFT_152767 [Metschnikowia bicuspidata var. bicuspidata NRRL YB-4993]OBA22386.1 hypothetical protein METBIDRAFT_152767 [Metschnikowia bicuspidata var. bicuspidata NRRL YB-4993]